MGEQWSVEHYGFPPGEQETQPPTSRTSATAGDDEAMPRRRWDRGRVLLAGALAAVVLAAGMGGFTVGHAVAGPPQDFPAGSTGDRSPGGRDLRH